MKKSAEAKKLRDFSLEEKNDRSGDVLEKLFFKWSFLVATLLSQIGTCFKDVSLYLRQM